MSYLKKQNPTAKVGLKGEEWKISADYFKG